jgi:PAS domain S-box-containing protein
MTDHSFFLRGGAGKVVIEAINNGADFYLQKGGDVRSQFAELAQKIRQGALRYRAELELKKKHEELQAAYEELAASEEEMRINFEELTKSRLALAESEKKLSDIINFLPDATFAIDAEGKILVWNKAIEEMTGYSSEVMVGKGDYEYALPFYGERIPILIDYILSGLPHIEKRYSNIQRDGNKISAETAYPKHHGQPMIAWAIASPSIMNQDRLSGRSNPFGTLPRRKRTKNECEKAKNYTAVLLRTSRMGITEVMQKEN